MLLSETVVLVPPQFAYTENWVYVAFAAAGSWIGAFASPTFLHRPARPLQ